MGQYCYTNTAQQIVWVNINLRVTACSAIATSTSVSQLVADNSGFWASKTDGTAINVSPLSVVH